MTTVVGLNGDCPLRSGPGTQRSRSKLAHSHLNGAWSRPCKTAALERSCYQGSILRRTDQYARKPGDFTLSCREAIPPIPHPTLPGAAPETRRSTSDWLSEVLRRVSGESPARRRRGCGGSQRAVGDAAAPISPKTAKSPALIGKWLWSRDIHLTQCHSGD